MGLGLAASIRAAIRESMARRLRCAPFPSVKVMLPAAAQWRETTPDAVYTQPDIPVPNTAGRPGAYTENLMLCFDALPWAFTLGFPSHPGQFRPCTFRHARQYGVKFGSRLTP
jgi:hypothetical protein